MKKPLFKTISLVLVSLVIVLGLTACGGAGASGSSASIANTYTTIRSSLIEEMGWYTNEVFTLELNENGTYQLYYNSNRFGGEDLDMRGVRTITYSGKYTAQASEDGEPSHQDVNLEAPTQITWEQHGKGFGRVATLPGVFSINTSAWTDTMTGVYDPEGNTKGAKEFLAEFAQPMTLTVEDPSTSPDDTTLSYRIVTLPDTSNLFESGN